MDLPRVSHGFCARPISVGSYRLTPSRYAPNQKVARHEHAFPSWTLVQSGCFEETFTRDNLVCTSGSALVKPATADHSNIYGPQGARCLIIEMLCGDEVISEGRRGLFAQPGILGGTVVRRIAQAIQFELASLDRVSVFSIEGLLIELALASSRVARDRGIPAKKWLSAIRDQLEAEFRSPPSLSALATAHDVHPVYLCHAFRSQFGVSVGEYVRLVRFEWARECLRTGSASISDIAHGAGFSDQSHFTRDFKARAGVSPRRFRQSASRLKPS